MKYALILLAGEGRRMNTPTPKQFLRVANVPVFIYTAQAFETHANIDGIVLVVHPDFLVEVQQLVTTFQLKKVKAIVAGGKTRQESVILGLDALKLFAKDEDIILIHDAARPLISEAIIDQNILKAIQTGACETVVPMRDTVISSISGSTLENTLNRDHIYQVQTPQTFRFNVIQEAHKLSRTSQNFSLTDDAQAVAALGIPVHFVEGNKLNFKITNPEDFALFEAWIHRQRREK